MREATSTRVQPVLSGLKVFKIVNSQFDPIPSLRDVERLVVEGYVLRDHSKPCKGLEEFQLDKVTHLRVLGAPHFPLSAIGLDNVIALDLDHLGSSSDNHISLTQRLPNATLLQSLAMSTRYKSGPKDIDTLLNYPQVSQALPTIPLLHLSIPFWPSTSTLSTLPPSLRSISVVREQSGGRDHQEDSVGGELQDVRMWKDQYFPDLKVLRIHVEGSPKSRKKGLVLQVLRDVASITVGFEVWFEEQIDAPLPGEWIS
ncbi:hypothetical protein P7C70_g2188, partial [Phenoliferia sp. Uapishka_3]